MNVIDRVKLLKTLEGVTYSDIAGKAGIEKKRLENMVGRKAKVRHEDIEAIAQVYPQYEVWLFTGKEFAADGQISPMTKEAKESLGTQGKVG